MKETSRCMCRMCDLSRRRAKALRSEDIDFVKKVLREFSDLWLHTDFDLEYCEAILDGSWPQAVEILTRSLEKAKAHVAKEEGQLEEVPTESQTGERSDPQDEVVEHE